jgi:hypothetical protein
MGHRAIIDDCGSGCGLSGYIDGVDDNSNGADDDIGGGFVGVIMIMIFQIKRKIYNKKNYLFYCTIRNIF